MGFQDYIAESEAASFTGVSLSTLKRFAEAGYFHVESDADGLRLFSKAELSAIFGLQPAPSENSKVIEILLSNKANTTPIVTRAPSTDAVIAESDPAAARTAHSQAVVAKTLAPMAEVSEVESIPVAVVETPQPSTPSAVELTTAQREVKDATPLHKEAPANEIEASVSPIRLDTIIEPSPVATATNIAPNIQELRMKAELHKLGETLASQEKEVSRLRALVNLQEKLLDSREIELADAKAQRSWLQARIEKLEDQTYRNQLLLLSEIQSNSKLLRLQVERKPAWRSALEWLGVNQSGQVHSKTISRTDFPKNDAGYESQDATDSRDSNTVEGQIIEKGAAQNGRSSVSSSRAKGNN